MLDIQSRHEQGDDNDSQLQRDLCSYFPHLPLKDKSLFDTLHFTNNPADAVYVLECDTGLDTNQVPDSDWVTHYTGDWAVHSTCGDTDTLGHAEEMHGPGSLGSTYAGYLYSLGARCDTAWSLTTETEVALSSTSLTLEHISAVEPAGYVRSFVRALNNGVFTPGVPVLSCYTGLESEFTGAVQERAGAEYYQRPASIDLSLVCTAQSMTVTLKTEETFTGRLFAQDTGRDCQILGTARTETKLSFYFEPSAAAKYGVERGERGVYSSVVVVQHHQVIQRKGDRAVKLLCYFETGDKVVTNSYDVICTTRHSNPPPDISWLQDAYPLTSVQQNNTNEKNSSKWRSEAMLQHRFTNPDMGRELYCVVKHPAFTAGEDSTHAKLDVLYKPTVHITRDETPVLEDGSGSINLTCSAESNPPVEGKWYKEADTSVAQYTDVIQYNPVTRHQAGTYVCRDVREDEDRGGGLV